MCLKNQLYHKKEWAQFTHCVIQSLITLLIKDKWAIQLKLLGEWTFERTCNWKQFLPNETELIFTNLSGIQKCVQKHVNLSICSDVIFLHSSKWTHFKTSSILAHSIGPFAFCPRKHWTSHWHAPVPIAHSPLECEFSPFLLQIWLGVQHGLIASKS